MQIYVQQNISILPCFVNVIHHTIQGNDTILEHVTQHNRSKYFGSRMLSQLIAIGLTQQGVLWKDGQPLVVTSKDCERNIIIPKTSVLK
jgi:hypothetical protein